ncbi:MAG: Redox-regulated ATPase YchF [Acidobacteriota bacterium]|nr:Redox-regulated ATPase YchF [Acidobacteriota bacterium]
MRYNYAMILTIFGYPKSGKTLLFNMLTGKKEDISKFSTSTHEFHKAVIDVPDERLKLLADFHETPPVYAKIEFLDTGAIAFRDSKDTTFIDLLRRADGLVHMIRGFEDPELLHPEGAIDPLRDIRAMEDELITLDFITAEKRLEKLQLDNIKIKSKELAEELELFKRIKAFLEEGKPLREFGFVLKEELLIRGFKFLSLKPLINIINADENTYEKYLKLAKAPENNTETLVFCGKIETELLELGDEDRPIFQEEYGLKDYQYMRDNFIKACYKLMNLISFFTVGSDETRAWTITNSTNAYDAAGKIHSDIQQGFIRAEVMNWKEFLEMGGFSLAKDKGLLRLEGKEYIVKDGEIVHIRFNK